MWKLQFSVQLRHLLHVIAVLTGIKVWQDYVFIHRNLIKKLLISINSNNIIMTKCLVWRCFTLVFFAGVSRVKRRYFFRWPKMTEIRMTSHFVVCTWIRHEIKQSSATHVPLLHQLFSSIFFKHVWSSLFHLTEGKRCQFPDIATTYLLQANYMFTPLTTTDTGNEVLKKLEVFSDEYWYW